MLNPYVTEPEAPNMDGLLDEEIMESMFVLFADGRRIVGCDGAEVLAYVRPFRAKRYTLHHRSALKPEVQDAVQVVAGAVIPHIPPLSGKQLM